MKPDMEALFTPGSVVVVGASRDPRKWGNRLIRETRQMGFEGELFGVNPSADCIIDGVEVVTGIDQLREGIDLAFLALPSSKVLDAATQCVHRGIQTLIVPSSGFGESTSEGAALEGRLLALAQQHHARLLGPNCFGLASHVGKLNLTPFAPFPRGRIGLVSQSGNVAAEAFIGARRRGLGFSHCVGIGNQLDLSIPDIVNWLAEDENTDAIGLYIEGLQASAGEAFVHALQRCRASGKPVVAIKSGTSSAGARVAGSHTRSLSSDDAVWAEVLASCDVSRAADAEELLDILSFTRRPRPSGLRIGVLTDGGGDSILSLDELSRHGLAAPAFSPDLQVELDRLVPDDAPRSPGMNPLTLDTAGGVEDDPQILSRCLAPVAASGEVDVIVIGGLFGTYTARRDEENSAARAITQIAARGSVVIAAQSPLTPEESEPLRILQDSGIPVFRTVQRLFSSLRGYAAAHGMTPVAVSEPRAEPGSPAASMLSPEAAWDLLTSAGIALPQQYLDDDIELVCDAARRIGFPVCLKVSNPLIVHKSDAGGVRPHLMDQNQLRAAAADILSSSPGSRLLVMPHLPPGFEIMLGARSDPLFGSVLVVGRGGVSAEIDPDIAVLVGTFTRSGFTEHLRRLRCAPLLYGARNQKPLATEPLFAIAAALQQFVSAHPGHEIDLNPVFLYDYGVEVADARVMVRATSHQQRGDDAAPSRHKE